MLHMNGADQSTVFTDSSTCAACPRTITTLGNAKISTAQSKFGGASGLMDGVNSGLTAPAHVDFKLPQIFTVDFWVRFISTSSTILTDHGAVCSGPTSVCFRIEASPTASTIKVWVQGTGYQDTVTLSANTWYHIAVTRSSSNDLRTFVDGAVVGNRVVSDTIDSQDGWKTTITTNLYYDEYRMIRNTAVWTAAFTPPTSAYTDCNAAVSPSGSTVVGSNPFIF